MKKVIDAGIELTATCTGCKKEFPVKKIAEWDFNINKMLCWNCSQKKEKTQ